MADVKVEASTTEAGHGDQSNATAPSQSKRKSKRKARAKWQKEKQASKQPKLAYDGQRRDYRDIVKDNENLSKYYKCQPLLEEGEFEQFLEGLRNPLPLSFRINAFDYGQAKYLLKLIEKSEFMSTPLEEFSKATEDGMQTIEISAGDDEKQGINKGSETAGDATKAVMSQPAIKSLDWYPNKLAWQMNIPRAILRKNPVLQRLHKFLIAETEAGFTSRQELVSMIPPLVLDVKRGHTVLDMCAAPGSKTAQLLEYLKVDIFSPDSVRKRVQEKSSLKDGLVVANEIDSKRCYMLVHQSSRLNSPNCVIINEDAARLPDIKTLSNGNAPNEFCNFKFDRVLCDVPCSGDGTLRKNPDVWRKWNVNNANNLHGVQFKILKRGMELLKEGGLLVYSTCSMNPVENEAVVAAMLRASKRTVILEDVADRLPGLKFRRGLETWTVMNRDMDVLQSPEEIKPEHSSQVHANLFPPSLEEAKIFNLGKCIRVLPHLQDTGGFFIAALRKLTPDLPKCINDDESFQDRAPSNYRTKENPNSKKKRFNGFREEPFFFLNEDDSDVQTIKEHFGLNEDFPVDHLFHRCKTGKKGNIYLASSQSRSFIISNQEESDKQDFVKIVNGGMRLFTKATSDSGFRLCQDGINEILPHIKDELKMEVTKDDLIVLVRERFVPVTRLKCGPIIQHKHTFGSLILIYKYQVDDGTHEMPLVAWRSQVCLSLYVSDIYKVHLSAILEIDPPDFKSNKTQEAPES